MDQPREWHGATPADDDIAGELELLVFDRIRALLVQTALPSTPPIYDLLWRYLDDGNHALSRAVDLALMTRTLNLRLAMALHQTHCIAWHDD